MFLGVLIELYHAGAVLLPVGVGGDNVVVLFTQLLPGKQARFGYARVVKTPFYPFLDRFIPGVFFLQAQLFSYLDDHLVVALGLADRLYTLSFTVNGGKMTAFHVAANIIRLEFSVGRQDDIGKKEIIFHPWLLVAPAFNRRGRAGISVRVA